MTRLGALVEAQLGAMGGGPLARLRLEAMWPELVGQQLSRFTRPESIEDGTLLIVVSNSSWFTTLQTMLTRLRATLAERCPELGVERIRLQLGEAPNRRPKPPAPAATAPTDLPTTRVVEAQIEATASRVADPELRVRLARLMRHDHQLRQWRLRHGWSADPRTGDLRPPPEPLP